jgi:hypothetical protein
LKRNTSNDCGAFLKSYETFNSISQNSRKAVYGRGLGWYGLPQVPKSRQGIDPRIEMDCMDEYSKYPNQLPSMKFGCVRLRIRQRGYFIALYHFQEAINTMVNATSHHSHPRSTP